MLQKQTRQLYPANQLKSSEAAPAYPHPFALLKHPISKNNTMGIGKGMPVRSLHRNPFGRFGDRLTALAAKYIFLFFR